MMCLTRLLLVVSLWSLPDLVLALNPADVPTEPAGDAIMATPAETAQMAAWAAALGRKSAATAPPVLLTAAGPPFSFCWAASRPPSC